MAPTDDQERFNALWAAKEELGEGSSALLLQAKALVLCALPYKRIPEQQLTRTAKLGRDTTLSVTFAAIGKDAVLPYGADRALLGWIQTRAYTEGFISFDRLTEFLSAFGLDDGGKNYRLFRGRVDRLSRLAVSIETSTEDEEALLNITPIRAAYYPKSTREAKHTLTTEEAGQLMLIPQKYGFQLDPVFWEYLRANPVPLPLPLMRLFHNKPKGWDFAQFVLYRCFAANRRSVVPWSVFSEQLGSTDHDRRRLKFTLKRFLAEMKVIYPDLPAKFLPEYEGLEVAQWRPPRNPQ